LIGGAPERALLRGLRRAELVRGIDVAREAGAREAEANLSLELGATFEIDGDVDAAASQYECAVGISRALGDAVGARAAEAKLAALRRKSPALREPDSPGDADATRERRASRKEAPSQALEISTEGAAFRAPGSRKFVAIQGRTPLRRILVELARRRVDAPGVCVPLAELGRAGWPGEGVAPASLGQRVRVATSALRKLGLARVILTARGGYLIAPTVAVVFSE